MIERTIERKIKTYNLEEKRPKDGDYIVFSGGIKFNYKELAFGHFREGRINERGRMWEPAYFRDEQDGFPILAPYIHWWGYI